MHPVGTLTHTLPGVIRYRRGRITVLNRPQLETERLLPHLAR
jgi:hypothetical protein